MNRIYKKTVTFAAAFTLFVGLLPTAAAAQAKTAGIDAAGMDTAIRPGDDFFMYANGTWYKNTEIPADRSSLGAFNVIDDVVKKRTASLIEHAEKAKDPESQAIAGYYKAFMNVEEIEKLGLSPLRSGLAEIAAIKDAKGLSRVLGSQLRADVDPLNMTDFYTPHLFGLFVSPNFTDPNRRPSTPAFCVMCTVRPFIFSPRACAAASFSAAAFSSSARLTSNSLIADSVARRAWRVGIR